MNAAALREAAPGATRTLFAAAEPLPAASLAGFGTTLVVAPHPDDETLGCGGLIALLGDAGVAVWPLLVTDGSASHPGSRRYDAAARRSLRDAEWRAALACLGVPAARLRRLGLPDGDVPLPGSAPFADATRRLGAILREVDPRTVVLPWRRDPHADHRAAHALATAAFEAAVATACTPVDAARARARPVRWLEYLVWTAERATAADLPRDGEASLWRLDIGAALARKRRALAAHRSQLGHVIDDDPGGFTIGAAMRARAENEPSEYFLETAASR